MDIVCKKEDESEDQRINEDTSMDVHENANTNANVNGSQNSRNADEQRNESEDEDEANVRVESLNKCHHSWSDSSSEDDEEGDVEKKEPIWDQTDECYRCSRCNWEIVARRCQSFTCGKSYANFKCERDPNGVPIVNDFDAIYCGGKDYIQSKARGTTPLLDVDPARLRPDTVAYGYEGNTEEYKALLARGASRLMCETFHLEFTQEEGIMLSMQDDLFDDWAGPRLVGCKSWMVVLGREIKLEPGDEDGSRYINEYLEDCLVYYHQPSVMPEWETVQKESGHWITRPIDVEKRAATENNEVISVTDSEEDLIRDDYDNSGDEDPQCDPRDDRDGRVQLGRTNCDGWDPDGVQYSEDEPMDVDFGNETRPPSEPDSFDSDFDSQEELSGDEVVIAWVRPKRTA
ncbi:hypothetical protein L218DRAFT_350633 [Marasmius fiardii PR-910]|nr:hypothetical protein L218DRAFT_350633 [Marasmius fiardii PR-910]